MDKDKVNVSLHALGVKQQIYQTKPKFLGKREIRNPGIINFLRQTMTIVSSH